MPVLNSPRRIGQSLGGYRAPHRLLGHAFGDHPSLRVSASITLSWWREELLPSVCQAHGAFSQSLSEANPIDDGRVRGHTRRWCDCSRRCRDLDRTRERACSVPRCNAVRRICVRVAERLRRT